ncbi:hypothetical protein [Acanthopleuribacter pedis]|uniref:Uncharacterized protein n=1 Tax=Acanthopleuribacter pedis TaxID=442870 RepID=A0A8J7U565_9BACT|nr:hypothetical protein [Acanthopleuribacter pedis]MBO1321392.1 hypothetical protein [Acanthopleuribacter pedis]
MDKKVQLTPFSARSIPTPSRRATYTLADVARVKATRYLAFDRHRLRVPRFQIIRGEVLFQSSVVPGERVYCVFGPRLGWRDKYVDEHQFSPRLDYAAEYAATRFRYWQDDQWGPWLAETPDTIAVR